jgi:hypothetical protein
MTENEPPTTTLPIQAPPVVRTGREASAPDDRRQGVEAARCSDLTGMARQICLASRGISI